MPVAGGDVDGRELKAGLVDTAGAEGRPVVLGQFSGGGRLLFASVNARSVPPEETRPAGNYRQNIGPPRLAVAPYRRQSPSHGQQTSRHPLDELASPLLRGNGSHRALSKPVGWVTLTHS